MDKASRTRLMLYSSASSRKISRGVMDAEDAIVCGRRIIEFCKGMYSKEPINLLWIDAQSGPRSSLWISRLTSSLSLILRKS